MATWTTQKQMAGGPKDVMGLLTKPDAIARWAPIPFEVLDFKGHRLLGGDSARVRGGLAGRNLEFTVDIAEASDGRLALTARGPIDIDVEYVAEEIPAGSNVRARVEVSGRGLIGRLSSHRPPTRCSRLGPCGPQFHGSLTNSNPSRVSRPFGRMQTTKQRLRRGNAMSLRSQSYPQPGGPDWSLERESSQDRLLRLAGVRARGGRDRRGGRARTIDQKNKKPSGRRSGRIRSSGMAGSNSPIR